MASNKWFPNGRKERNAIIATTSAFMHVIINRTAIGFAADTPNGVWYDAVYSPRLGEYNENYNVWLDPATSTVVARDNLQESEDRFFPLYRKFYGMVKASALVTNGQLEQMGFPPRPSGDKKPHPVDKTFIDLNVIPLGNLVLNVAFENRDTGESIIPYYLTGAVIYYLISDTPITNQELLAYSRLATRSPFELAFSPDDRGKIIYLAARWQNRRGELGPWSEIVSAVIP
jgi:hypothetical protein